MNTATINNLLVTNIAYKECESIEKMAKSAAIIAFYNFKWQFVTLVLFKATLFCGVNTFIQLYKKNTLVASEVFLSKFPQRIQQYVIFGTNMDDIINLLNRLDDQEFDNSAKYLIICQSNERKDCDEVDAVGQLWKRRIINVIFINDAFNNGTAGFYYQYSSKCKNTPPIKIIDWDACVNYNKSKYCAGKYPIQLKNLHGCPIIVSTFSQPPFMYLTDGVPSGADGDLLRVIIYALNASLVIMEPTFGNGWGNLNDNGSWVGSLGDVYYDLANISMTSACVTDARHAAFEMSSFYFTTNIIWVTHPKEIQPPSHKLLRPFRKLARMSLVLSFLVVILLALIFKTKFCITLCKSMNLGQIPDNIVLSAWQMCMGQTISVKPLKTTLLYLMLIWIWYCFLVRTFYQVHLINSLKTDIYYSQLSSIEDAIAENYPFGGGPALRDYYLDFPTVYDNWKNVESTECKPVLLNLTTGWQFVMAVNLASTKKFLKTQGRKLHILPKQIISSPTAIFLKKFSPLASSINHILKLLFESGWPQKFFKDYTNKDFADKLVTEDKPIKLRYCTGCYLILVTGWFLSGLLLIIEIYLGRRKSPVIAFSN